MKKLLIFALVALVFASCEKEVIVEKIVEVPVEVDTSDMPEGLKDYIKSIEDQGGDIDDLVDYMVREITYYDVDFFIFSYGKNTIYTNSEQAPILPRDVINMQAYLTDGEGNYQFHSYVHFGPYLEDTNTGAEYPVETFSPGVAPIFNNNFFNENQYVFKIFHRKR